MRDVDSVQHFNAAPWSTLLRVSSTVATALIGAVCVAAFRVVPYSGGFTHNFGIGVAFMPVAVLAVSLLFVVTGYTISSTGLGVRRLFWTTWIPLTPPVSARFDPEACRRSMRLFGNAGLFAFTGLYRNSQLGRYRLFATDFRCAVVLRLPDRTVVVSPDSPQAFVNVVRHFFPSADDDQR